MKKYWYKLLSWIGFEIEDVPEETKERGIRQGDAFPEKEDAGKGNSNIVSIHQAKQTRIIHIIPGDYEQVQGIADHLKNNRPVIVNMETVEKDLAKRILDFLSGTTYAISGTIHKINPNIVMVLPQSFALLNVKDNVESIAKNDYLPWKKTTES